MWNKIELNRKYQFLAYFFKFLLAQTGSYIIFISTGSPRDSMSHLQGRPVYNYY